MPGELQSLIDGQISKGGIGGRLVLPKRAFDIEETVHIASVRGLQVVGEGPWATELRWQGTFDTPMFDVDRCQDVAFEDCSITVGSGKQLHAAAWIQNGEGATGPNAAPGVISTQSPGPTSW